MSAKTDEILESLKSLSLLEASELVKQIEEAFGVSAAASAGVVMAAPGAAAGGGVGGGASGRWLGWRATGTARLPWIPGFWSSGRLR